MAYESGILLIHSVFSAFCPFSCLILVEKLCLIALIPNHSTLLWIVCFGNFGVMFGDCITKLSTSNSSVFLHLSRTWQQNFPDPGVTQRLLLGFIPFIGMSSARWRPGSRQRKKQICVCTLFSFYKCTK